MDRRFLHRFKHQNQQISSEDNLDQNNHFLTINLIYESTTTQKKIDINLFSFEEDNEKHVGLFYLMFSAERRKLVENYNWKSEIYFYI